MEWIPNDDICDSINVTYAALSYIKKIKLLSRIEPILNGF